MSAEIDAEKRPQKDFVHLHLHSDYSLLNSAIQLKPLSAKLKELGQNACALTDYGNLFGAVSFFNEMRYAGLKPIIGYEAFLTLGSRFDRSSMSAGNERPFYQLLLIAENDIGFKNLVVIASKAFTEGLFHRPRVDLDLLAAHSEGLICISSAFEGPVGFFLAQNDKMRAKEIASDLGAIFGPQSFFLEICPPDGERQKALIDQITGFARQTDIPLVATNDVHYLEPEDAAAYEVAKCIREGRTLFGDWRSSIRNSRYLRSAEEMWAIFGDDFLDALQNTVDIAERCNVSIPQGDDVRQLPDFPIPPEYGDLDINGYFEKVLWECFEERKKTDWEPMMELGTLKHALSEYEARLKEEIEIIERMGFPGYFLIVWDFIRFARDRNIPVGPGRGSAAGSLTAFCMRITDVDPLQYDLLFERFLNPERISMPDIDIDFCIRGRGEVIDHVVDLYGRESVCQIITFATLASKAVIKDVARVLGMTPSEADRIAKLVPPPHRGRTTSISEALEKVPELSALVRSDPRVKEVVDISLKLENGSRHTSVHAAGVVISPKPLHELVPVAVSDKEELTSQYPMGDLEKVGMLKMDFLGLTTLTVINDCITLIKDKLGVEIDWGKIPTNDEKALKLFAEGRTEAIFQFESQGMQEICRKMGPKELEDLSALNALYRPGPLDGGMVDDFIARYKGTKPVEYILPEMEEILGSTFGVLVYQEQIMQLAQKLAGYSLGEADLMRRAMGKKKVAEMAAHRDRFIEGAVKNGFNKKISAEIFDLMAKFADYGFNRSHSMAYAILAFRTAYLKAHYPAYFYASVLTHEAQDSDKVYKYSAELRSMGLKLLPPDINESDEMFTPVGDTVRYGLTAIKGLGASSIRPITEARTRGKFKSMMDLCTRVPVGNLNRRALESLVSAGAFDSLNTSDHPIGAWRAMMFSSIDSALQAGQRAFEDRVRGQSGLFGHDAEEVLAEQFSEEADPWTLAELAERERGALGFYLSAHPLDAFGDIVRSVGAVLIHDGMQMANGTQTVLAGSIGGLQIRTSRQGNQFANFRLEDRSGSIKCAVLGANFEKLASKLSSSGLFVVEGKIEVSEGQEVSFKVSGMRSLDEILLSRAKKVVISITTAGLSEETVEKLFSTLENRKGRCSVELVVDDGGMTVRLDARALRVDPSTQLRRDVEQVGCGIAVVT
jgi:DNA polymerase-3 subunit alpha